MATVNLLPNADVSNSPAWTIGTGSDVYAVLDDDHSGLPPGDASQIRTIAHGKKCVVQFQDLDYAGLNIDTIDSVQAVLKVGLAGRGNTYRIGMSIRNNGSGAASWAEQTINDTSSLGWNTNTFTKRTTSTSGGDDWEEDDFGTNALAMEIHAVNISGNILRVTYAYYIVTYTEAVTADNATFFGANF